MTLLELAIKQQGDIIASLHNAMKAQPETDLSTRVRDLENRYRMLNARIARKQG